MSAEAESTEYIVRVHEGEDGTLWAEVLDLPGCFAAGDNLDELREALGEAISLYVADDPEAPAVTKLNKYGSMRVDEMRVKVPA